MPIPSIKDILGDGYDPKLTYVFASPGSVSVKAREGWTTIQDYDTQTPSGYLVIMARPIQPGDQPPNHRNPAHDTVEKLGAKTNTMAQTKPGGTK